MHFGLSDEEAELASTLHTMLERRANSQAVRAAIASEAGYDTELWRVLCDEMGVASLAIPEEFGGAGFGEFANQLVLEELGYSLAPTPMLGSTVVAQAIMLAGNGEASERLLPAIASGDVATLAWADEHGRWRTDGSDITATQDGDSWHLSGRSTLVLDGHLAGTLLVVGSTPEGVGIFEVDDLHVERIPTRALDPALRFATISLADAPAQALTLDAAPVLEKLRSCASIAVTGMQVGVARRGLDMTVAYSKVRTQFGRTIGSFQALKHRMADMLLQVETARTVSWAAAWAIQTDAPDLAAQAALAKAWATDALEHIASETVQLHGGIAITWEHDAQLVFKRAHALGQQFGDAAANRRELATLWGVAG